VQGREGKKSYALCNFIDYHQLYLTSGIQLTTFKLKRELRKEEKKTLTSLYLTSQD